MMIIGKRSISLIIILLPQTIIGTLTIRPKITKPTLYLIRDLDKHFGKKPQELVDELYFPVVPEDLEKGGII